MDFGNILEEWEKAEAKARKEGKKPQAEKKPQAAPPALDSRESMKAYLNRYGVVNKDEELDAAAERENLEKGQEFAKMRHEASIDLHGLGAAEAERRLGLFLQDSRRRGLTKVLIIHGKGNHSEGDSVLGPLVRRNLDECSFAGRRGIPEKKLGGRGAVWVILRKLEKME
jgi:DNA-nicking Smr family endonuclease